MEGVLRDEVWSRFALCTALCKRVTLKKDHKKVKKVLYILFEYFENLFIKCKSSKVSSFKVLQYQKLLVWSHFLLFLPP